MASECRFKNVFDADAAIPAVRYSFDPSSVDPSRNIVVLAHDVSSTHTAPLITHLAVLLSHAMSADVVAYTYDSPDVERCAAVMADIVHQLIAERGEKEQERVDRVLLAGVKMGACAAVIAATSLLSTLPEAAPSSTETDAEDEAKSVLRLNVLCFSYPLGPSSLVSDPSNHRDGILLALPDAIPAALVSGDNDPMGWRLDLVGVVGSMKGRKAPRRLWLVTEAGDDLQSKKKKLKGKNSEGPLESTVNDVCRYLLRH